MNKTNILLSFLSIIFVSSSLNAKSIKGVEIPEKLNLDSKELILNGAGIRKATLFKVKVYVSSLYLIKRESDATKIINQEGVKQLNMQFLMGLNRKKLTDAWTKSLREHCPKDCSELKAGLSKLNSYMKSVRKKDRFEFTIYPNKVLAVIKGEKKEAILGKSFVQAFLKVFVGPKEIDEGMAKSLRGQ